MTILLLGLVFVLCDQTLSQPQETPCCRTLDEDARGAQLCPNIKKSVVCEGRSQCFWDCDGGGDESCCTGSHERCSSILAQSVCNARDECQWTGSGNCGGPPIWNGNYEFTWEWRDERECRNGDPRNENGLCEEHLALKGNVEDYFTEVQDANGITSKREEFLENLKSAGWHTDDFVFELWGDIGEFTLEELADMIKMFYHDLSIGAAAVTYNCDVDQSATGKFIVRRTATIQYIPNPDVFIPIVADENGLIELKERVNDIWVWVESEGKWKIERTFYAVEVDEEVTNYVADQASTVMAMSSVMLLKGLIHLNVLLPDRTVMNLVVIVICALVAMLVAVTSYLFCRRREAKV